MPLYNSIIIVGNLNINMFLHSFASKCLRDFCDAYDLYIVPFGATHHTSSSQTWIDHCIVNDQSVVIDSFQPLEPFLSGQDIISVSVDFTVPKQELRTLLCRNWKLLDSKSIERCLANYPLPGTDYNLSADELIANLNRAIFHTLDTIAPVHLVKATRPPSPWFNEDIRELQHRRNKLYRIFKRTGYAYTEYSNVRRLVKQRILSAKKAFLESRIVVAKLPKLIWDDFRRLGLLKRKTSVCPPDLDLERSNCYFVSVSGSTPKFLVRLIQTQRFSMRHKNLY